MTENMSQLNIEIADETKRLAKEKLEHGGLTRVVREELERIAHGEQTTEKKRVKDNLEELREERHKLKNERQEIDNELEEVERDISRAEARLDELRDKEGEYEGVLQMIEHELHENNNRVFVGHGKVERAAKVGDCSQDDVIADLKDRNPELPDTQFTEGLGQV